MIKLPWNQLSEDMMLSNSYGYFSAKDITFFTIGKSFWNFSTSSRSWDFFILNSLSFLIMSDLRIKELYNEKSSPSTGFIIRFENKRFLVYLTINHSRKENVFASLVIGSLLFVSNPRYGRHALRSTVVHCPQAHNRMSSLPPRLNMIHDRLPKPSAHTPENVETHTREHTRVPKHANLSMSCLLKWPHRRRHPSKHGQITTLTFFGVGYSLHFDLLDNFG